MRMRTLPQAIKCLRESDPETALTLRALRRLVAEKRIPVAWMTAKKPLIDLDKLEEYLYITQPDEKAESISGITPIPEKL